MMHLLWCTGPQMKLVSSAGSLSYKLTTYHGHVQQHMVFYQASLGLCLLAMGQSTLKQHMDAHGPT